MFFSNFVCIYHFFPIAKERRRRFTSNPAPPYRERSNFYVKAILATRTAHRVSALGSRQAELTAASRALAKHVRFAIAEFGFAKLESCADPFKKATKRLIFPLTLVNISRKEAKHHIEKNDELKRGNDPMLDKKVGNHQSDRR